MKTFASSPGLSRQTAVASLFILASLLVPSGLMAQDSGTATPQGSSQQQAAPPEAGGPQQDSGPYAIPRVNPDNKPPQPLPPPPSVRPDPSMPSYSINVQVPLVSLDTLVLANDGQTIPGLKQEYFRVLEDNVPQSIQSFTVTKAGYTAVMLIEFASTPAFQASRRQFLLDALRASYAFTDQMQKNDYVAVISYDMTPRILVDFTNDKQTVYGALDTLRIPGMSETCLYDALNDTLDRLSRIEGRKEIILISSGLDTLSRMTYDKILKKIKATPDITIYPISTGFLFRTYMESTPGMGAAVRNLDYLQGDNQMQTFAKMTGGRWFNPRFQGELPEIFREISASVRNQYTITYRPTNAKLDGTYRKLKVQLLQPGTDKPLIIKNQNGKEVKYHVIAREGYTARHEVE